MVGRYWNEFALASEIRYGSGPLGFGPVPTPLAAVHSSLGQAPGAADRRGFLRLCLWRCFLAACAFLWWRLCRWRRARLRFAFVFLLVGPLAPSHASLPPG